MEKNKIMKKLLLILLCLPMIGLGQIKVVNSSKTTVIGEINGNDRKQPNTTEECLGECQGIRLEKKDNLLYLIYNKHNSSNKCFGSYQFKEKGTLPPLQFTTTSAVIGEENIIKINDNGSTLDDLFNLIKNEFDGLDEKEVEKCNQDNTWNIIRKLELDIGEDNLLILEWIGNREDGKMWFKYKGLRSFWLDIVDVKKLFGKE
jgi:hypothetical protein